MCVDIEAEMAAINAARVIINNKSRFNLTFGTIRELSRMAELEPALRRMLPFQGHAVFIRAEEAPDDTAIRTMLGLPAEDDGSACDDDIDAPGGLSDRGGRPSKRQEILNAYSQAFPEGRSPRPWKEIFQAVREQGIDASDVTIKRALKATGDSA